MASDSGLSRPCMAACLVACTDSGEHSAITPAQRSAVSISRSFGTTSFTSPRRAPSAAVIGLPVSIIPMAILSGMLRGRRCTPPAAAMRPTRGSGNPNVACSAATMTSHASAISRPPPSAKPFTAAMIGFNRSKRAVRPANPFFGTRGMPCWAVHLRSLPAENAFSPAPVRMPTQQVRVGREIVPHPVELLVRTGMEGVHHLRTVDGHHRDVVALLVADELERHAASIAQGVAV